MGIGLLAPQLAPLLGMYNIGKSIYDFGGDIFGYTDPKGLHQIDVPNYAQYIDPDRYDGVTDPSNVSFSENPGIGFSNKDPEDVQDYGNDSHGGENDPGNTSGGFGGDDDE